MNILDILRGDVKLPPPAVGEPKFRLGKHAAKRNRQRAKRDPRRRPGRKLDSQVAA